MPSHRRAIAAFSNGASLSPGCVLQRLPRPLPPLTTQFKTHNAAVPNRLTSSRSIENAPAFRFRARARSSSRRSVSDTALGLVARATVYASSPDRPIAGIDPHQETDASGHFAFHGLRWGHYYIYAGKEAEGYAEKSYEFFNRNRPLPKITLGPNNQTATLTVQLGPKAGRLTGTVTDAVTSAPLSPCVEFRWAADPNNFWSSNGVASGKFRILIPSDTDVVWKVWLDGYKPWYYRGTSDRSMATSLRLLPGRVRALRIELQPDAAAQKTGCPMPNGTVIQP